MKAFGLELRRYAETPERKPPLGEYGGDGESVSERYVEALQDVNPALSGRQKFDAFDEMVHTDSTAKSVIWVPKLAVRSAHWAHEAASDDPVDQLIARAADWNFGLGDYAGDGFMAQSWAQSIDQAAFCLRYGSMFEEIVWSKDLVTANLGDGIERLLRPIERLAPRLPRTIREVSWRNGRIDSITQDIPDTRPIPGEKLVYYALDPEPGRWDGVSLLRAAWGPWELKRQLMIAAGIAWDRWASGFPEVRYPKNGGQAALEKAEELGRAIRNHEHAYAAFEGAAPTEQNGGDGWSIDIKGGAGVLPDPTPLMIRYELAIYGAGLMQWMALGTSSQTGARATAETQDEPFYMFLEAFAGDIALERQRQVLRRFVDVNFGTSYRTPRLTVSKIQSEDVEKLARILAELRNAGFNFSDRELQNYVRVLAKVPELPDGDDMVANEGDGLPALDDGQERQLEQRRRDLEQRERDDQLRQAVDQAIGEVGRRLERIEAAQAEQRQLSLIPAPPQPVIVPVHVPASTTEPELVRMFEETLALLRDQATSSRELPPLHFDVRLGRRSAKARKVDDAWVVDYQDD